MQLQASVIIPTYADWDSLQTCLDCLGRQSAAPELFEVIVANNNPSAEVPPGLRLPANARVIHVRTPGSYAARNAAIQEARGEVLFFTDSDCQPDARWIEAGLEAIAGLGPHGRVAGAVELFPKGPEWTTPELYDRVQHMRQALYSSLGWSVTANLVARRATFALVGPFDAEHMSLGDCEWGIRAFDLGSEIVFGPATVVRHPARSSFAELAKKRRRVQGGQLRLATAGKTAARSMASHLSLLRPGEIVRILTDPGLQDRERLKVLWLAFRLGGVALAEMVRLRYLSGKPRRS